MMKKRQVVMLPTDKAENAFILNERARVPLSYHRGVLTQDYLKNSLNSTSHYLYILSDEEIKEGDWGMGYAVGINNIGAGYFLFKHDGSARAKLAALAKGSMKIIATTNPELKGSRGQFNEQSHEIPKLPQDFIEAYVKAYNEGKPIEWINVEYDTIEEPAWSGIYVDILKLRDDNTIIIHKIKERKYSREEVEVLLWKSFGQYAKSEYSDKDGKDWIKQQLKELE